MASDEEEDDFALLTNDDPSHHHQQQQQPIAPPLVSHLYGSPTSSSNPTAAPPDPQHFRPNPTPTPSIHHNNNTAAKVEDRSTKRPVGVGNGDELSDDGTSPYSSSSKKARRPNPNANTAEYRKDREEWSDSAIACLLDAYTDKYMQLNRGNLRGRDWEEVAATVSHSHQNKKSVEQCKNKVDNLKKRYKAERHRITSGTLTSSHWPWFKKMEHIVSSSPSSSSSKPPIPDNDVNVKSPPPASSTAGPGPGPITQPNRYMSSTSALGSLPNNMKLKSSNPRWQRVVLKISGSVFAGSGPHSVDPKVAMLIAREISMAVHLGVQVAVVVGGRNFFCGNTWITATGVDRTTAYQIGMMATVMNAVLLQASLEKIGIQTRVQTTFMMQEIAEPYIRRRAIRHLEKGRVVIFGGVGAGPGNPLFTTDTAAALRASEISANAVLKGTNIDNGYGGQPRGCSTMPYENVSYRESISRGFSAMDMTAITFCEENNIPVVVFNLLEPGNISKALCGDQVGTLIDRPAGIS